MANPIFHALVLNLHQPAGNLEHLLADEPWAAQEILYALDRIPRALWPYEDLARVHLALSGTLLEKLAEPAFQERVYGIVKCGDLLWHLQHPMFEVLGTGYYHPVLPLIPAADRPAQLERWLGLGRHLFGGRAFPGFWPPEMGFSMELIPLLARLGYRYVLVDSENVEPVGGSMRWEELRYRPHVARHGGAQITVIVRDRDLSNAQESGMDADWFLQEVEDRTRWCDFPALVTTATDGDNGGWFRNTRHESNFWGAFYQPLLERVRRGESGGLRPTAISDYLARYGVGGEVRVRTAAWNTGWHHGVGFVQWTGSQAQKDALARVATISAALHATEQEAEAAGAATPAFARDLEEARWRLLRAETSCHFFWGEAWVPQCHALLDEVEARLATARGHLPPPTPGA